LTTREHERLGEGVLVKCPALAVKARAEFVAEVEVYVGVAAIPERFRPTV